MRLPTFLFALAGMVLVTSSPPVWASDPPEIEKGFRLLYQLRFDEARANFRAWQGVHPEDSQVQAFEAASYLFQEFYRQGVLTSEFFLDDKRLLGGVQGQPDAEREREFLAANMRARDLAKHRLQLSPKDPEALFVLTITAGMLADYAGLIKMQHLETLKRIHEAEAYAKALLAADPDAQDAYLTLGAAHYILGSLPGYKRLFLVFVGIQGDKRRGMMQLQMAATHGHYLRPFAKILLALVALREKQDGLAHTLLEELEAEFPENPIFARELAKLGDPFGTAPAGP